MIHLLQYNSHVDWDILCSIIFMFIGTNSIKYIFLKSWRKVFCFKEPNFPTALETFSLKINFLNIFLQLFYNFEKYFFSFSSWLMFLFFSVFNWKFKFIFSDFQFLFLVFLNYSETNNNTDIHKLLCIQDLRVFCLQEQSFAMENNFLPRTVSFCIN